MGAYRDGMNENGTSSVAVAMLCETGDNGVDGLFEHGFGFEIVGIGF